MLTGSELAIPLLVVSAGALLSATVSFGFGLVATPFGVLSLNSTDPGVLKIIVAVVIMVLGLLSLVDISLPLAERRLFGPIFGFASALVVTSISIGGPLAAVYAIAQKWAPQAVRAPLALLFLTVNVVALALYSTTGLVHRETLTNIGVLAPGLLARFAAAAMVVGRLDARAFRYLAGAVILTGAVCAYGPGHRRFVYNLKKVR